MEGRKDGYYSSAWEVYYDGLLEWERRNPLLIGEVMIELEEFMISKKHAIVLATGLPTDGGN